MSSLRKITLCMGLAVCASTAQAESYRFNVHNKTDNKIVKLLVSEDGTKWSPFDVGDGIAAGATETMEWNEAANDQDCEQHVKAVYDDKSESEAESFDFCEKGLELDFEE